MLPKRTFGKSNDQETSCIRWTRAQQSGSETRSIDNFKERLKGGHYIWLTQNITGTGKEEKKSVARVYLVPGTGKITINKRDIDEYLGLETLKVVVRQPLVATGTTDKFDVIVNVHGGGYTGQAGAIRHGISRALLEADAEYRPVLKSAGYLTRDPRMKERKKYGLKAARRAPQFSKR